MAGYAWLWLHMYSRGCRCTAGARAVISLARAEGLRGGGKKEKWVEEGRKRREEEKKEREKGEEKQREKKEKGQKGKREAKGEKKVGGEEKACSNTVPFGWGSGGRGVSYYLI